MDSSETPNREVKVPLSYQKADIIYKLTFFFANTHLEKDTPIAIQMLLMARSITQNVAKASAASATSPEMEIKFLNVAKVRLDRLRADYKDFLTDRQLRVWDKYSQETTDFRLQSKDTSLTAAWYVGVAKESSSETVANMCISLLYQMDSLLHWQQQAVERDCRARGRLMERMQVARAHPRQNFPRPRKS